MRHAVLSLVAVLFLTTTLGLAPAYAQKGEAGQNFSLSLGEMKDLVSPGDTMTGSVTITIFGDSTRRVPVTYEAVIKTPLGDAPLQSGSATMRAGRTRTIPFEFAVDEDAAPGEYILKIAVTVAGETLTVTHTFFVAKGA